MKNGNCDVATNIPQCVFDGGDCLGWFFVGPYLMQILNGLYKFPEASKLCNQMKGRIFEPRNHSDLWLMNTSVSSTKKILIFVIKITLAVFFIY